jgi:hypothetical protein
MATTSQGGGHGDCDIMTDHGGLRGHLGGRRGRGNRRTAVVNGRGHVISESVMTHMEATATTSANSGGHEGHHGGHRGRVNRRTAVVNGRGHEIRESVKTHFEATATTSVNGGGRGGRHGGRRGHHGGRRGRGNRSQNAEITAWSYDQLQQQHHITATANGQRQCPYIDYISTKRIKL